MAYRIVLVLVVGLLGSDVTRAAELSCFDEIDACTQDLRTLMMDEEVFWFGTQYGRNCAMDPVNCINPDTEHLSIMSRLYNTSDKTSLNSRVNSITLADVEFQEKEGHYYGCGHTFKSYGKSVRVDPMKVLTVDSWTIDHEPTVLWASDPDTYYTVAVWDVGYQYLHGLYINARDGDTRHGADVIDPYHGPINPSTKPNIYLFGVFRQTAFIDQGMVYGIMGRLLGINQGALPMSAFLTDMSGMIAELTAANVMSVIGDAYSMERQKNSYVLNNCPKLITQSPGLKNILRMSGVNAIWTPEKNVLDYSEPSHISTLTTDLSVEYSMARDIVVDSCCVKTTFTQSLYRPDPLGTHVTKPAVTNSTPRIKISPINIMNDRMNSIKDQTYTLMMVDMTDASNLIIHWMVTDIKNSDVTNGNVLLPYLGPNPFESNQPRTYVFFLLKQQDVQMLSFKMSDFTKTSCPDFLHDRCGAQVSRMLQELNIQDIAGITWFQAVQDAYARKRLYSDLMVKTMVDVCDGQPGFEWPCPKDQYCGASNSATNVVSHVRVFSSFVTVVMAIYCLVKTV